jgi:two-component system sensor histidine kinase RegB
MAYLIHVVLAALLLGAGWTWGVSILCSILYALLFVWYVPVPELSMGHHHGGGGPEFNLHLQGMLAGFVLISFLISGFLQKMRAEIDWREKELVRRRSNEEKLAAVTTVSASVAHELGTPLGSMMLVVSDMQEELRSGRNGGAIREDLEVIRQQLERCAEAITRLGQNSGELFGEMPLEFSLESVFKSLGERLTDGQRARVDFSSGPGLRPVILPKEGLQHVLHALVKNALEASGEQTRVLVSGEEKGEALCLRIQDSGAGMSQEDLKRVGEPFFTTKDSGRGMGLGLFIAKLFTERLGGTFDIVSTLGMGTRVEMQLPRVTSWKATP